VAATATPRPGRTLAIVAGVLVALYLGLFLGPSATPKLGLDLRGGTQITLTATPISGTKVTKGALGQAVDIIRQRVDAAGVGGAEINTQGSANIVVSAPGVGRNRFKSLDQTALLRFRQVLGISSGTPQPTASTSVSPAPAPSASIKLPAKSSGKTSKKKTSSHDIVNPALLAAKASSTPSPTPTPAATSSAAASPAPSTSANPTPSPSASTQKQLPGAASPDLATVQQFFQNYDCSKDTSPTAGLDNPADYIVSCDTTGAVKYLLAPAGVEGSQIGSADAVVNTQTNEWLVQVNFSGSGKGAWFDLTKKAYEADPQQSQTTCAQVNTKTGCNEIAITLDGVVQSAPSSQQDGIAGGQTQITGQFTQRQAQDLANVLKFGALPLKLVTQQSTTVSASLGSDQLRGGLIAGLIGLGLVVVYSLLYYRALGLVTVASLALSGLILYAVTALLGHSSLGYTLSLPGIAGFIVAVGITADSFVVFFERLRDEVREGRRLRSGVERAWPRARRTIISADAVSLLAAVVLYLVSIGDVRGFAFTLGLSTLSDVFIVFCFTKPLLSVIARWRAFDAGEPWTGVGRARSGAVLEPREV
jgi:preprotein translocase subunit SecD